jgi:pSer/pThr/pTyr-binding forkhead associated (FHA) protein
MPSLIVTSGLLAGQVFSFSDVAIIGRGQFSEVRLNDPTVSRRHAQIRRNGQHYELRDQDSANGTFCRGQRVVQPVLIEDGDELQFGEVKAVFRSASSEQPSLAPLTLPAEGSTRARTAVSPQEAQAVAAGAAMGLRDLLTRLKLFCDLGALTRRRQDLRELLGLALEAVQTAFPQTSRAAVYLQSAGGEHLAALAQRERPGEALDFPQIEEFLKEALRREHGLNVIDAAGREALATRLRASVVPAAVLGMPLRLGDETLGALYLDSAYVEHAWRAADQELFAGVAGLLAWMIASTQGQAPERTVEAHDLALARRIQQRFLPQSPPTVAGYRFADSYAAARVIGGDFYDFFHFRDGRPGLVIADVSGKAVSGALYMARLSVQVRTMARHLGGPAELLAGLNHKLYQELEPGMFVTMLAALLDAETGTLRIANAGHPAPLLHTPDGGVRELGEPGALPLGAMADTAFREFAATLPAGGGVLFYTDGLDEAHNAKKELFGKERILRTLADAGGSAQGMLDALLAEIARFTAGEPQSDDLTLITLSRDPGR